MTFGKVSTTITTVWLLEQPSVLPVTVKVVVPAALALNIGVDDEALSKSPLGDQLYKVAPPTASVIGTFKHVCAESGVTLISTP